MKKWSKIVCIAVVLVAIIVSVVRSNSLNITLYFNGYQKLNNTPVLENRDNNGNEVRILKVSKKENKAPALVYLTKNNFGFWEFNYGKPVSQDGMAEMFFVKTGGFRGYPFPLGTFEWEWHDIYCGNNANRQIEFEKGELPENVTVSIQQSEKEYTLHFISFSDTDTQREIQKYMLSTFVNRNCK